MYAHFTDADASYLRFLQATDDCPDLAVAEHRRVLLVWLNSWGCRQFEIAWHPRASEEIRAWYDEYRHPLCRRDKNLWELSAVELSKAARAYASLSERTASWYGPIERPSGRKKRVGKTGAAKIMFAIRPRAFPPWDGPITEYFGYDGSAASYLAYLEDVRRKLEELEAHCDSKGIGLGDLADYLGRPTSTVAKLIDEFHWVTVTKKWSASDLDNLCRLCRL